MISLFKRFLFKKYRFNVIVGPLFKLIEATLELLVPFIIKFMIEALDGKKRINIIIKTITVTDKEKFLYECGAILFIFSIVGLLFSLVCQYLASWASQGMGTDLRNDLYRHINSLSFKELDMLGSAEIITRMNNDIKNVEHSAAMVIRLLIRAPYIVIGATILSFLISPLSGIIFLVTSVILFVLILGIMFYSIPKGKKAGKKLDDITTITKENLSGNRVIRAFSKQEYEKKRFNDKEYELYNIQNKIGVINSLLSPFTFMIVTLASIVILVIFKDEFINGNNTRGDLQALINYFTQIQIAIIAMTGLINLLTKGEASARRINEIYSYHSSIEYGDLETVNLDSEYIIEFNNVTFKYNDNSNPAIDNISFKLKKGETLGIIGGTGSGKSTIVNLINRFYDSTEGEILLFGNNIRDYKKNIVNENISTVMQKPVLFKGSIKDNLLKGKCDATIDEINRALDISMSSEFVSKLENSIDTVIYQGGKNLSGGQKQRLSIARAIIKDSPILILDDSSSALDYKTELSLRKNIKKLDSTNIIISQRATSIIDSNLIIVLDNGKICGMGSHNDLIKNCEVYKEICYSQDWRE